MTAQAKETIRSCIACRKAQAKQDLLRIVFSEGAAIVDPTGRKSGRGAYLCPSLACLDKALKRNQLSGALRQKVDADNCSQIKEDFLRILKQQGVVADGTNESS